MTSLPTSSVSSWETEQELKKNLTKACKAVEAACVKTGFKTPRNPQKLARREDLQDPLQFPDYKAPPVAAEFADFVKAAVEHQQQQSLRKKKRQRRLQPVVRKLDFDNVSEESFHDAEDMSQTIQSIMSASTEEARAAASEASKEKTSQSSKATVATSQSEVLPHKTPPATTKQARHERYEKRARLDDEREQRYDDDEIAKEEAWSMWDSLEPEVQTYFSLETMRENRILSALFKSDYENPHMLCLPGFKTDQVFIETRDEQLSRGVAALKTHIQLSLADHRNAEKELAVKTSRPTDGPKIDVYEVDALYKRTRFLQKRILYLAHFLRLRFTEAPGAHKADEAEVKNVLRDLTRAPIRCENTLRLSCDFKKYHAEHGEKHPPHRFPSREERNAAAAAEAAKAAALAASKASASQRKSKAPKSYAVPGSSRDPVPPLQHWHEPVDQGQGDPPPRGTGAGGGQQPPPRRDPSPPEDPPPGGSPRRDPPRGDRDQGGDRGRDQDRDRGRDPDDPDDPDDPGDFGVVEPGPCWNLGLRRT